MKEVKPLTLFLIISKGDFIFFEIKFFSITWDNHLTYANKQQWSIVSSFLSASFHFSLGHFHRLILPIIYFIWDALVIKYAVNGNDYSKVSLRFFC